MSGFGYDVLGFGSGAVAADPPEVDDQFNRVSFLSNFDGANNGVNNVYDDGSASNRTVTVYGDVTQGSFGPFARPDGEWGVSFDGDGDSLTFTNDATMSLDGDYTFELFFNAKAIVIDTQHPNAWLSGTTQLFIHASDRYVSWYAGGADIVKSADNAILTNVWNHVAVVRSGTGSNNTSLYLNGTRVAQTQNTATLGASSGTARIGSYSSSGGNFDGQISNLRILKGTALYSGSSITVPTSKLTAVSNTKLLTCQSNRFVDNSASAHTIAPAGNAAVSGFGPFLTSSVYDPEVNGASAYFDGNGDSLTVANSSDFDLGQTFTIDTWLYRLDTQDGSIAGRWYGPNNAHWIFHIYDSGKLSFGTGDDSYRDTTSVVIPLNSWVHVAVSNDSSGKRLYINGVQSGSHSQNNVTSGSSKVVAIAANSNGDSPIKAYLYNLRIIKGTAVYTGSTYTVPTAPLTAVTNTKLLLNMANGQAIDSTAQNNLTLYNTAKLSTAQAKFGDTSLLLAGTTGNGSVGGGSIQLEKRGSLSGPFTIETWAWADDTTNAFMWCQGQYRIELGINGNTLRMYKTSSITGDGFINFFTGGEFSVNTWHHVALVRDTSNVIKCYLNGTASGTTLTDATEFPASDGVFSIGSEYNSSSPNRWHGWDGYLDEFRISEFARYTSNFTVPNKPFPIQGQV